MGPYRAVRLDRPVDPARDHISGPEDAEITLVEYGSYLCQYCHAAHEVIRHLVDEFGDRLRYVYRHLPLTDRTDAVRAAELAEYVAATTGEFWPVHQALMQRGPRLDAGAVQEIAAQFGVPDRATWDPDLAREIASRVRADARSGLNSGARVTPTFFINGRRYEGPWDELSLKEAMFRSLGHRIQTASLDFARWAPSTGLLLAIMTIAAVVISNSPWAEPFLAFWERTFAIRFGQQELAMSLLDWVDNGLLTIFFLVVGLEIKRELTVGRLADRRAAALPLAGALGGMIAPAVIFFLLVPAEYRHAWGMTITTDTAFAVALLVVLGDRVPVDLRVFLTAAVIVDDLVAIVLVALIYSGALHLTWLAVSVALAALLFLLNRMHVYRALPYAVVGVALWLALHESGIHATLAGVVLAVTTPTRPPANLSALLAHAQAVIDAETRFRGDAMLRTGPSESALRTLDDVHDRIESPASKLLRATDPWSSYFVLPVFALANAGLVWSTDVIAGREQLVLAIAVALVLGKFSGVFLGARLAVAAGVAVKPSTYTWRQLSGAGALAGIGFTMSLFIAGRSLPESAFPAAKVAIFLASFTAAAAGLAILWTRVPGDSLPHERSDMLEIGTPVGEPLAESG